MSKAYVTEININGYSLWKGKKTLLSRLDLELTERCNNDCAHCYINLPADDAGAKQRELSTDKIKNILAEAVALGCMTVRFTGGEPLLRDDFEELYVFAREQGLKVLLFTNAVLLDQHLAQLFSRIPPRERIEVTVYGMHKSSYEAVTRTAGSFEKAWNGMNLLLEHKVPFVVKGALLPQNRPEINEFESWARTIPWMADQPPSYSMFFDLRCRRDAAKSGMINKLRITPEEGLAVLTRHKERYVRDMKEFCSKFMRLQGDELFSCGAGCGGCVDAYGYFQPCMLLRHPDTVYDLGKGSLKDVLTNFFPGILKTRAANSQYLEQCAVCFLKGLCEQCPAKSWMEHGTLDTPVAYLCEIAHAQARFLGLIRKDEKAWEITDWQDRIAAFVGTVLPLSSRQQGVS